MDRQFFASVVARERSDEISKDLAVRHWLNGADGRLPGAAKPQRLILRFAPTVIVISLIALFLAG